MKTKKTIPAISLFCLWLFISFFVLLNIISGRIGGGEPWLIGFASLTFLVLLFAGIILVRRVAVK